MKRHSNRHQLRLISEVSITPMLDLVLVLLFVILLAAPLLKADRLLLPKAAAPAPSVPLVAAPAETMTLSVHRDLSVTLNGAMLARADLPASLKHAAQRRPDLGIEVRIHRDLPVQHLVDTMQVLDKAGIRKTAVVTHADEF
ncbi:MAG: biopolymer transporter ExbD [Prosthecobacter sp.]|jgi:biopolymer transport protein ExbD|uniref:ExbD/TolR family protein n=1 Tax=Prosthecobacter sp. TaxID=1965333 RepID=UPI0019ED7F74|nr:biopolymer transporter ExbD [Prosthecobacter sp.]MBE2282254.1 biopolymer transporter ExbD [Prosthecobacter sp.]